MLPPANRRRILKNPKTSDALFCEFFTTQKCATIYPPNKKYGKVKSQLRDTISDILAGIRNLDGLLVEECAIYYDQNGGWLEDYKPKPTDMIKKRDDGGYCVFSREAKFNSLSDKAKSNVLSARRERKLEKQRNLAALDKQRKEDVEEKRRDKYSPREEVNFEYMFTTANMIKERKKKLHPHERREREKSSVRKEAQAFRDKVKNSKNVVIQPESDYHERFFKEAPFGADKSNWNKYDVPHASAFDQVMDKFGEYYARPEARAIYGFLLFVIQGFRSKSPVDLGLSFLQYVNVAYGIATEMDWKNSVCEGRLLPHYLVKKDPEVMKAMLRDPTFSNTITELYGYLRYLGRVYEADTASLQKEIDRLKKDTSKNQIIEAESFLAKPISFLKDMRNGTTQLVRSSVIYHVKDILQSLISLQFFGRKFSLQVKSWVGQPEKMSYFDALDVFADGFVSLLSIADKILDGNPLSEVLLSGDPVRTVQNEIEKLMRYEGALYTGLPVQGMMCKTAFVNKGTHILDTAKVLLREMNPLSKRMTQLQGYHDKLDISVGIARSQLLCQSRPMPFAIILHGEPGIGKSKLLPLILATWSRVKGRDYSDTHVFHRIVSSEYWEGYDPLSHPFVHYSEVGNISRDLVKSKGDAVIDELTSLIDTISMPLNVAFDGKGKVYARPELVIIDTNNADMNLDLLVSNKAAYERRFLYICPQVLDEFREAGGCGLDIQKSLESDRDINDRWSFDVYRKKPESKIKSTIVPLMRQGKDSNIYSLIRLLTDLFTDHVKTQDEVLLRTSAAIDPSNYLPRPDIGDEKELIIAESDIRGNLSQLGTKIGEIPFSKFFDWGKKVCGEINSLATSSLELTVWWFLEPPAVKFIMESFGYLQFLFTIVSVCLFPFLGTTLSFMVYSLFQFVLISVRSHIMQSFMATHDSTTSRFKNSYNRLFYYLGLKTEKEGLFSRVERWATVYNFIGGGIISIMCIYLYKYFSSPSESDFVSVTHPRCACDLHMDPPDSVVEPEHDNKPVRKLQVLEELTECSSSYKRVPVKGHHQLWNNI